MTDERTPNLELNSEKARSAVYTDTGMRRAGRRGERGHTHRSGEAARRLAGCANDGVVHSVIYGQSCKVYYSKIVQRQPQVNSLTICISLAREHLQLAQSSSDGTTAGSKRQLDCLGHAACPSRVPDSVFAVHSLHEARTHKGVVREHPRFLARLLPRLRLCVENVGMVEGHRCSSADCVRKEADNRNRRCDCQHEENEDDASFAACACYKG